MGFGLMMITGDNERTARAVAQELGVDRVLAFIGGMHLTGGLFESIIPQTVSELSAIYPEMIVPGHCTGWRAAMEIARRLPEAFIQSSVGTTLHLS